MKPKHIATGLLYAITSCANPNWAHEKVIEATGVKANPPTIWEHPNNGYHPFWNEIYLNEKGFKSEEVQIHEYLHWAFEHLSYKERSELFAVWGTEYILRGRRQKR